MNGVWVNISDADDSNGNDTHIDPGYRKYIAMVWSNSTPKTFHFFAKNHTFRADSNKPRALRILADPITGCQVGNEECTEDFDGRSSVKSSATDCSQSSNIIKKILLTYWGFSNDGFYCAFKKFDRTCLMRLREILPNTHKFRSFIIHSSVLSHQFNIAWYNASALISQGIFLP